MTGRAVTARLRFLWVFFRPEPVEFWTGLGMIGWGILMFCTDDIRIGVKGAIAAGVGVGLGLTQLFVLLRNRSDQRMWRCLIDAAVSAFLLCIGIGVVRQYGAYPGEAIWFAWAGMNLSSAVRLRLTVW